MSFVFKKKILNAALMSSILYSCESWLTSNTKSLDAMYHRCLKILLGVRQTTPNMLCKVELGMASLSAIVTSRRVQFMRKFQNVSNGEEPLALAMQLCETANTPGWRLISAGLQEEREPLRENLDSQKEMCIEQAQRSSKVHMYVNMNPSLEPHPVYDSQEYIPDRFRIAFSRFRLSAHYLRIVTGRGARLPRDMRICSCGAAVQDEQHVLLECALSLHVRDQFPNEFTTNSLSAFFDNPPATVCKIIHNVLSIY